MSVNLSGTDSVLAWKGRVSPSCHPKIKSYTAGVLKHRVSVTRFGGCGHSGLRGEAGGVKLTGVTQKWYNEIVNIVRRSSVSRFTSLGMVSWGCGFVCSMPCTSTTE